MRISTETAELIIGNLAPAELDAPGAMNSELVAQAIRRLRAIGDPGLTVAEAFHRLRLMCPRSSLPQAFLSFPRLFPQGLGRGFHVIHGLPALLTNRLGLSLPAQD